jgi:hypothetical protein
LNMAVRFVLALILIVGLSAVVAAQVPGTTPNLSAPGTTANAANLQIVAPANGQKIGVDFVDVRYQITNPAAAVSNMPTFQVQLDGGDPVRTSSTDHTFTGLRPGPHTVIVEVVDANDTPVAGTRTEVHFFVAPTQNAPARTGGSASLRSPGHATVMEVSFQQVPSGTSDPDNSAQNAPAQQGNNNQGGDSGLPSTGSALPLLSVIGFGVLVGGIASALKTR